MGGDGNGGGSEWDQGIEILVCALGKMSSMFRQGVTAEVRGRGSCQREDGSRWHRLEHTHLDAGKKLAVPNWGGY